jgi:hypothetical protein
MSEIKPNNNQEVIYEVVLRLLQEKDPEYVTYSIMSVLGKDSDRATTDVNDVIAGFSPILITTSNEEEARKIEEAFSLLRVNSEVRKKVYPIISDGSSEKGSFRKRT